MAIEKNMPDRAPTPFVGVPEWSDYSRQATTVIARFELNGRKLEVALVQTGEQDVFGHAEIYPFLKPERWAAFVRDPVCHTVFGAYEFFAGPVDYSDNSIEGKRLEGKAIAVDPNFFRQGLATRLVEATRRAGLLIVPSGNYTKSGAGLMKKIARRRGELLPKAITLKCRHAPSTSLIRKEQCFTLLRASFLLSASPLSGQIDVRRGLP